MQDLFITMQSEIIFTEVSPNSIAKSDEYHEHKYEMISSTPISLYLDDSLSTVYDNQVKYGIELPVEIVPDRLLCANGYSFNVPKPAL